MNTVPTPFPKVKTAFPASFERTVQRCLAGRPLHEDIHTLPLPDSVESALRGRAIMITGAGGTIGRALAIRLASLAPSPLILVDHAEAALFDTLTHLQALHPKLNVIPALTSITNTQRITKLLHRRSVFCLFHTAAYKHVPLAESNPLEVMGTNVVGTHLLAQAAISTKVGHFVYLSSDKAARPRGVMSASKRLGEDLLPQNPVAPLHTRFSHVRFGNILGSSGSVLPIFARQITMNVPLSLTNRQASRYFVTLESAVTALLSLAAQPCASGGFVCDEAQSVRLGDLADWMLSLSPHRFTPPKPQITGLRPGEALHEHMIWREVCKPSPIEGLVGLEALSPRQPKIIATTLSRLAHAIATGNEIEARQLAHEWCDHIEAAPHMRQRLA